MAKSKLTKPQIRQKAKEIVDGLLADLGEEICAAIRQELSGRVQKPKGRRPAANWDLYLEMGRRLASGMAKDVIDAARSQAHRIKDVSWDTAVNRLRTNYPKYKLEIEAELRAEAEDEEGLRRRAEKDAAIALAFEEDVEAWDL